MSKQFHRQEKKEKNHMCVCVCVFERERKKEESNVLEDDDRLTLPQIRALFSLFLLRAMFSKLKR